MLGTTLINYKDYDAGATMILNIEVIGINDALGSGNHVFLPLVLQSYVPVTVVHDEHTVCLGSRNKLIPAHFSLLKNASEQKKLLE